MIGMIFQFNTDAGTGLIMLSDGEQKEFSTNDWVDESNMPAVGLQILYEDNDNLIKIKIPSEEEKNEFGSTKKPKKEKELTSFASLEEFQNYFSNMGFDLLKTTDEAADNELTLGKFTDEGVQSVSISFKDSQSELTKKIIPLSSIDEHIQYFKNTGYRLINDSQDNGARNATLRRYVMDVHSEITIEGSDEKVTVTKTINGKKVS